MHEEQRTTLEVEERERPGLGVEGRALVDGGVGGVDGVQEGRGKEKIKGSRQSCQHIFLRL